MRTSSSVWSSGDFLEVADQGIHKKKCNLYSCLSGARSLLDVCKRQREHQAEISAIALECSKARNFGGPRERGYLKRQAALHSYIVHAGIIGQDNIKEVNQQALPLKPAKGGVVPIQALGASKSMDKLKEVRSSSVRAESSSNHAQSLQSTLCSKSHGLVGIKHARSLRSTPGSKSDTLVDRLFNGVQKNVILKPVPVRDGALTLPKHSKLYLNGEEYLPVKPAEVAPGKNGDGRKTGSRS